MSVASVPQLLQEATKFAASHRAYANELAPAYADFHNSVASLLERLAAALTESETRVRALGGDVGASAEMWREWNRLHDENATLREALREISLHGTTAPLEMGDVSNDAAWWKRIAHDCISTAARAVLAQGKEHGTMSEQPDWTEHELGAGMERPFAQPPQAPARGDAPSVDEIRRRLAVYAVSIDGFDSLNPETQELLTTCAEWVDRELAAQPPARPTVPWPHQPHCNLTLRRRGEGELFDCTCVPDEARPTEPSALMRNGLTQIQELAEAAHNYLSCEINVGVTDEMKRQACQRLASLAGPHSVAYSSAPLAPPPPPETP